MKIFYLFSLTACLLLATGCSKDILKKYDKRIVGTWRVADVDRFGLGGNIDNLSFTEGAFTFFEDGTLKYFNSANSSFTGRWDIVKKTIDDQTVHGLIITAVDSTFTITLSQYYDDINFVSTTHFRAKILSGFHSYITHFRR